MGAPVSKDRSDEGIDGSNTDWTDCSDEIEHSQLKLKPIGEERYLKNDVASSVSCPARVSDALLELGGVVLDGLIADDIDLIFAGVDDALTLLDGPPVFRSAFTVRDEAYSNLADTCERYHENLRWYAIIQDVRDDSMRPSRPFDASLAIERRRDFFAEAVTGVSARRFFAPVVGTGVFSSTAVVSGIESSAGVVGGSSAGLSGWTLSS
ncbi:hypothetical protein PsorP6_012162 [Peronosclerospora sorghi]|uniref:Uncharacterized protein n=1 Tax=Peronosclerospora sorghi TaxID=230839 RepID=A0ACC0WLH5_9STRA|nr:hypothetical protein PsorP6_012162 [Peronosclerospora sorghi]